jgi:hypothetical protein
VIETQFNVKGVLVFFCVFKGVYSHGVVLKLHFSYFEIPEDTRETSLCFLCFLLWILTIYK